MATVSATQATSRAPRRGWPLERVTAALLLLIVAAGLVATGRDVARGVEDRRVTFHGRLDLTDLLQAEYPRIESQTGDRFSGSVTFADPRADLEAKGFTHVSTAEGESVKPRAGAGLLALWATARLLPWVLAAIGLWLVLPLLRATERGRPFVAQATRKVEHLGALLIAGSLVTGVVRYVLDEAGTAGISSAPTSSAVWQLPVLALLGGMLLHVLARAFRRGAELEDLERLTV